MVTEVLNDNNGSELVINLFGDGEPIIFSRPEGENEEDMDYHRRVVLSDKQTRKLRRLLKQDREQAVINGYQKAR